MIENENSSNKLGVNHLLTLPHRLPTLRPLTSRVMTTKSSQTQVEPNNPIKTKISEILNGLWYNIFISIITLYALFADDLRQCFFPPSADLPFTIVLIICVVIYITQLVLMIIIKPEYFRTFFFWLDLVSIGTMIFDFMWINVGGPAAVATNIVQITRAGKATRIGARSARIIRIVKLMKNVQQYKTAKQEIVNEQSKSLEGMGVELNKKNDIFARRRQAIIQPINVVSKPEFQESLQLQMIKRSSERKSTKQVKIQTYSQIVQVKQTRISIKLKQSMETNTTFMIICLLLSIPLLSSNTWFQETPVYQSSIQQLNYFLKNGIDNYTAEFQLISFINQSQTLRHPIVYLKYPMNQTCCQFPKDFPSLSQNTPQLDDLRASSTITQEQGNIIVIYNTTDSDIFSSQLNLGRTLFVTLLLILSSLFFSKEIQDYLLEPLDSMLTTVKKISSDPLKAVIAIQNQKLVKSTMHKTQQDDRKLNQPAILQDMMMKIGSLLVVGFGQAGSKIIVKNIQTHGAINPVLSGTKMIAIFGFCDIRNFTDATEVLQTGVMNFVNDIAAIVHRTIHKYAGSANKNIGDAFLLVWKFKKKQLFLSDKNGKTQVTLRKIKKVSQMADLAVFSFMKIIAQLTKAYQLKKYTNNQSLKDRIKDFRGVKMGFGLHVGWAIEGAIGSRFKIDASYLSPNVNMASRLEAATKQFGVLTLISGQIAQLMTNTNRKFLRQIDRVTVKGSIQPIQFFTLDLCPQNLDTFSTIKKQERQLTVIQKKKMKMFTHKERESLFKCIQQGKSVTQRLFINDKDFQKMRQPFGGCFFSSWQQGYQLYIKGCWQQARKCFENTLIVNQELFDGPSKTLIQVLQQNDNKAPIKWQGFRQLTQK